MLKLMNFNSPFQYNKIQMNNINAVNYDTNHFGNDWGLFVDLENLGNSNKLDNYELMKKKYNINIITDSKKPVIIHNFYDTIYENEYIELNKIKNNDIANNLFIFCLNKTVILGTSIAFSYAILYTITVCF